MKVYRWFGVELLDTMMYGIRAAHAAVSLLSVWAAYRIVRLSTRQWRWAMAAGLIVAVHFAMPYLAVRSLIEMVGGHFWLVSVYLLYRYREQSDEGRVGWLYATGIITGLAWMIRFEIAFAAVAVPLVLLIDTKRLKPSVHYSLAVLAMLVVSGLADLWLLGTLAGSTIKHLEQVFTETPPYDTNILIYPAVLLAFFVPPFSIAGFWLAGFRGFWRRHKLLVVSSLVFLLLHTASPGRQERYIIPILPAVCVILILASWQHWQNGGVLCRRRWLFRTVVFPSAIISAALLVVITGNYSHRGSVEPLAWAATKRTQPSVAFVSPEVGQIYPLDYGGFGGVGRMYVNRWPDLAVFETDSTVKDGIDYYIPYPPHAEDLAPYLDSLQARIGPLEQVLEVPPSAPDRLLHCLNPKHNLTRQAWIYQQP